MTDTQRTTSASAETGARPKGAFRAGSFRCCGSSCSSSPPGSSGTSPDIGTAGPARPASRPTDDAYMAGDVTPLAAKFPAMSRRWRSTISRRCTRETCWLKSSRPTIGRSSRRPKRTLAPPRQTWPTSPTRRMCSGRLCARPRRRSRRPQADLLRYHLEAERQRDAGPRPACGHASKRWSRPTTTSNARRRNSP